MAILLLGASERRGSRKLLDFYIHYRNLLRPFQDGRGQNAEIQGYPVCFSTGMRNLHPAAGLR
jgi:hypothetical protein